MGQGVEAGGAEKGRMAPIRRVESEASKEASSLTVFLFLPLGFCTGVSQIPAEFVQTLLGT